MYSNDNPIQDGRPKAGQGLVMMMMMTMSGSEGDMSCPGQQRWKPIKAATAAYIDIN